MPDKRGGCAHARLVPGRKDLARLPNHEPLRLAAGGRGGHPAVRDRSLLLRASAREELPKPDPLLARIALVELAESIEALGSRPLRVGAASVDVVPKIGARELRADRVVGYRCVGALPDARRSTVAAALDVPFALSEGETLAVPGQVKTGAGAPFARSSPRSRARSRRSSRSRRSGGRRLRLPPLPPLPASVQKKKARQRADRDPDAAFASDPRSRGDRAPGERAAQARLLA